MYRAALCGALAAFPAFAESKEDVARANALFTAGKALLEAGRYEDACTKFAQSKEAAAGIGVTLYLADCLERVGRTASAWSEFRSAEGLARERGDRRADVARERAEKLEPNLCRLTIDISNAIPREGLHVQRDGVAVSADEWGVATPVDPGDHVVIVSLPNRPSRSFEVKVGADDAAATVRVEPEAEATAAASHRDADTEDEPPATRTGEAERASVSGSPAAEAAQEPSPTMKYVAIGVGVAGVVGLGVGTAFGIVAKSKFDDSNDGHCDVQDRCDAQGLSLRHDALAAADIATVGLIAGGVALAGGIVLYIVAPKSSATRTGVTMTPVASAHAAGLFMNGRF